MSESALYVHVADDGGILVIDGETGLSAWVVMAELVRRLAALQAAGGTVLLSQGLGSPIATAVLEVVDGTGLPVVQSRDVHPDAIRAGGATTLMFAAYVGAVELAEDLVQRGADLRAQDDEGFSALMYAANAGQGEITRLLVEAGADVNQVDHEGSTALMFAAQHGHLGVVKTLLAGGADISASRPDGLSARDFADRNGHQRVSAILLSAESQRL
jgi:ankyrin repeat protein